MIQKVNIDSLIHDLAINELLRETDDFYQREFELYVNGDTEIKQLRPEHENLYHSYLKQYEDIVMQNVTNK